MYRFQISAHTQMGEIILLVGSPPQLGAWHPRRALALQTSADRYPLWWIDLDLPERDVQDLPAKWEYKYIRRSKTGQIVWEALGLNRWIPLQKEAHAAPIIVEEGWFGQIQPWPYGYWQDPVSPRILPLGEQGLKIVVIGSSVALGCSAWLLRGWASQLAERLHHRYGHQLINQAQLGANVTTTLEQFDQLVTLHHPHIVIVALSLGNEGLPYCPPHHRRAVQRRFESGLLQLVKLIRQLGALPILGSVYPHADYTPDHGWLLQDTHERMKSWGIPLLDWLAVLHDGQGGWKEGLCFDAAHPNSEGHRLMVDSIDLGLFDLRRQEWSSTSTQAMLEIPVFQDAGGLHLYVKPEEKSIRVMNSSAYSYGLSPGWTELQTALTLNQQLMPGIYIANSSANATLPFFSLTTDRKLETYLEIHPNADLEYHPAFHAFSPHRCQILFYDGHVGILKESDLSVRILNESDHDYNLHPMWQEVRSAFKGMAAGVYTDPLYPDMPFRTLMVGPEGLESRIKVAAKSSFVLHYQGPLSSIRRVGIVPLGDRCAVRMMLYKMEYDGPAFPFDLTRTTNLGDVADMIASGFHDMWNPALLQYDPEAGRIYHRRWTGLSFAHEVEDNEDPIHHMDPIYARMRTRYQARAQRFWYTVKNADELLFVRTGSSPRGYVLDLMHKLRACCQDKPLRLLVLSPQASWEFAELPDVLHFQVEFNPDQMYDDLGYWLYCTEVFRGMLNCLGVSCKTLFWCPPQP